MKNLYLKVFLFTIHFCYALISNAQIIADGTYIIHNTTLDEVISVNTVAQGQPDNPQDIIIGRARMEALNTNNNLQQWVFTHQGDDVYIITNVGDDSILGVKDGWCGDFGDVQVGFDNTSTSTLFKVVNGVSANTFVLQIAFDENCNFGSMNDPIKVFDIDGGNSGSKINTFTADAGNANQEFQIVLPSTLSAVERSLENSLDVFFSKNEGLVLRGAQQLSGPLNVSLYDISGKTIRSRTINTKASHALALPHLKQGMYIVRVQTKTGVTVIKKFVIE